MQRRSGSDKQGDFLHCIKIIFFRLTYLHHLSNQFYPMQLQLSHINEAQILEKYCPSLAVPKFVHLVKDGVSLEEDFGMLHLPPQPLPTFGCRVCSILSYYFGHWKLKI